jgi:exosortase C (VPDSG-CTERM-specific)
MPDAAAAPDVSTVQARKFAWAAAVVTLAFALPLWKLIRFSLPDEFYSYVPLMPFISGYLVWILKGDRRRVTADVNSASRITHHASFARVVAFIFCGGGIAALAGYLRISPHQPMENQLALATLSWLLFLTAAGCWFLGGAKMRSLAFPFFLLIFMVPLPAAMRDAIEGALQHGSATVADGMFTLSGMAFLRDGTVFQLPGIVLQVAPECSGIHSTWILFITSLVAAFVILRRPWKRAVLCLAVIPLALLRNGFRVFVIGELCVHVGPHMINSPIHRRGGPLFFVLSLIPLFLLLYFLRKNEQTGGAAAQTIRK